MRWDRISYSKVAQQICRTWALHHTRCFIEPIQLLPHPGLDYGRFTHIMAFHIYEYLSTLGCPWPKRDLLRHLVYRQDLGHLRLPHRGPHGDHGRYRTPVPYRVETTPKFKKWKKLRKLINKILIFQCKRFHILSVICIFWWIFKEIWEKEDVYRNKDDFWNLQGTVSW